MEKGTEIKLYKLFAKILYDVGRGYGSREITDFISYILKLNASTEEKLKIVKTALQLAIVWKELGEANSELMKKLIEDTFSNLLTDKKIDIEKVKGFIEKLATHKGISNTKLRGTYLEGIL